MKLYVLTFCALLASGCSMFQAEPVAVAPVAVKAARQPGLVDANGAPIERVPFVPGRSSATVEKMAKLKGCTGGQGAGLMTPEGPVEVYRMMCQEGRTFMARCELRQCKAM
ncbi:hypothetical protein HHL21_15490 [Massilia sp. RP-1-19]|uniref:Lipoprotein n=1 Tax=Massilia polaris TaxID=2728846 RepID=A0A848HRT1_9BURK|nr:hypothetical protein [Massilia polaris]NML62451.1 hypothetical protein [Massilia polaris]